MSKIIGTREHVEHIFRSTLEIAPVPSAGMVDLIREPGAARPSTDPNAPAVQLSEDSNWIYGYTLPSDVTFIVLQIDAIVVSGRNLPNLAEVLSAIQLQFYVDFQVAIERCLVDVTSHDSVLEARLAAVENFLNEFRRFNEPAAKAMRALGAKLLGGAPDLRRLAKPVLVPPRKVMEFRASWPRALTHERPILVQVRLRGIRSRDAPA